MSLPPLNLPSYDCKLQKRDNKLYIFDQIRKKYLQLTPEEWVRQHFIHFLSQQGFPKSLMSIEAGLKLNKLQKRTDIVIYDRQGKPFMLVECKAPEIKLSDATFNQAASYNMVLKAPYLSITNGMQHYFCHIDFENKKYSFLETIPKLEE
ncbi:type I restriction enzyme HsdR N-terminal domain-containing protein [Limibacter armeniacum]|uniref:type I restriction enzyme HsdR N-terminal domain-containing protein n=1 Tax=Limibacter armeniacum TaxID=466084 RepID=UPI002FE57EA4